MLSPGIISIKDSECFLLKKALYGPTNETIKNNIINMVLSNNIYLYFYHKKTRFHITMESR